MTEREFASPGPPHPQEVVKNLRVVSAAEVPLAERAALWTEAFSDYFAPGVVTAESLAAMEQAFDLDRDASRIVIEDGQPAAFAMLGLRGPVRAKAAGGAPTRGWVGGMGVIPSARRRGHGERVMVALLDAARERALATVRLEVLVQNTPAIPLYERLGFRTLGKLEVWERSAEVAAPSEPSPAAREIPLDEAAEFLGEGLFERTPWQRELAPTRRVFPELAALASEAGGARAVLIHRTLPERVGIVAIGVTPSGGATAEQALDRLLASLFASRSGRPARLLNLPEGDPASAALARSGAVVIHRQWEMELTLA